MNQSHFAMAIHFHQPIGNFQHVMERAYKNCYFPFINFLLNYPDIKVTIHFSGCLLDYFEERHKEMLGMVRSMVERRQVEVMAGAYYEPILISIPRRDLEAQIELMKSYIRTTFGYESTGMWIPERVWVPELAPIINKSGIKYCILDDTHFKMAGVKNDDLYGYYLTGPKRRGVAVFPSDKHLRYAIPFKESFKVMDYFKEVASSRKDVLFVYGDDGEKFGEWPGTHKWVYQEKWLEKFFNALKENSNWLKLVTFSEYMNSHGPIGMLEIPEASYDEMMEWDGGSWKNFLSKYPESNQMHKKMCYVSDKVEKIEKIKLSARNIQKADMAKRELYKGQCNCAYWHGVFGGLYLYHLRSAVYSHLIEAEKIADGVLHEDNKRWKSIKSADYDGDGADEIIMENDKFSLYFDPQEGGILKEFDYRELSFNIINTLSRKKESYHRKIIESLHKNVDPAISTIHTDVKKVDASIEQNKFVYDKYPRYCLRDIFFDEKLDRISFMNASFKELGGFSNYPYTFKKNSKGIVLKRKSTVSGVEVSLSKAICIESECIEIIYSVEKKGSKELRALLGIEFNITMPYLNSDRYSFTADNRNLGTLNNDGGIKEASSFGVKDSQSRFGFKMDFSKPTKEIWYFPVLTISQSERAYELNYQCSSIFPIWKPSFDKKGAWGLHINLTFNA